MAKKFIKTAIALAVSSISCASFAASSFVGSDDASNNVIAEDIFIEASSYLTYTNSDGSKDYAMFAIFPNSKVVSFTGSNIKLNVLAKGKVQSESQEAYQAVGIDALSGSKVTLGSANSNVEFNLNSDSFIMGIRSGSNSIVEVNGKNLIINAESFGTTADTGSVYGLYAQNSTADPDIALEDRATLIVNSENTVVDVKSASDGQASALVAMSQGVLKINGNLYASGDKALVARGDAIVRINESNTKIVQLDGDVDFNYDKKTSGTAVDADVLINLTGSESYWNGSATVSYGSGSTTDDKLEVTGLKLGISDGAVWTPTLVTEYESENSGEAQVSISELTFNDGVINVQNGSSQVVEIENMTGTGGTVNLTATTDGKTIEAGSLNVAKTADGIALTVNARGINSDDITDPEAAMASLNEKVSADVVKTSTIAEGDVNGALTQTVAADGTASTVQIAENTKLASMKGVNAAALVAWRDEVAYTNQRMEYLRDGGNAYGAWAQVYGGESSYDDGSVDLKTTTVQVGADTAIGDWVAGAAFSYMNGDADMHNGSADTDAYTLSLYASRMFDSGLFVNGLARYGRLSTDATAGNMDGSYDNNAFSIGGNVGYRFTFAEQAFVEPSFGLQYAYVMGDDYTASNGVKVEQDDFDALIASLGARIGFNFAKDAGKIYARASVNHDFMGEIDGTAGNGKAVQDMYVDLGGTWFTYGIGTQFNITDNLSVWGNLDRTTGGEVSTNYMMNAGVRYVF